MNSEPIIDPEHTVNNELSASPVTRAIFRDEALQHYIKNEEKVELPASVSPQSFIYLWVLALVLTIFGLIVAFWPLVQGLIQEW